MNEGIEQQSVLFHDRARMILTQSSNDFKTAVLHLDRQWDENVFQLQHSKYESRLKHQLLALAQELMANETDLSCRHKLSGTLNNLVGYYVSEFRQKTGA